MVECKSNLVQVGLCGACRTIGCASGGYVHISNNADLVFWTPPHADVSSLTDAEYFPFGTIKRFGSIGFTANAWDQLRAGASEVPERTKLPDATRRVIRDSWVMERNRLCSGDKFQSWLSVELVAADSLDKSDAIQWVESWLLWFHEMETTVIRATVSSPAQVEATIKKLFFDGPADNDWSALAR